MCVCVIAYSIYIVCIYIYTAIDCCRCISTYHIVYIVGVSFDVPAFRFTSMPRSVALPAPSLGEKGC